MSKKFKYFRVPNVMKRHPTRITVLLSKYSIKNSYLFEIINNIFYIFEGTCCSNKTQKCTTGTFFL